MHTLVFYKDYVYSGADDGKILAWNKKAEEMYGYTELEALNKNIYDLMPQEDVQKIKNTLCDILMGKTLPSLRAKRIHKNGQKITIWLTVSGLTDSSGKVVSLATTERSLGEKITALEPV